ncbi:MAG: single-stranded-DNA-specific exonuclease RecJ [Patescibacteria group bacterium]
MKFDWQIQQGKTDDIVETLLANRGIKEEADVAAFLNPDWDDHTYNPMLFQQMKTAVDRLFHALENQQKIVIHGDYDADGVCGSALLYDALRQICERLALPFSHVEVYLPDRERDGYGVAMHTIERLGKEKTDLLITVDCGIANADELDYAHELALDVIICDHHQLAERLPQHALIIHPLAPGETYPNKHLCGTGVAFKFASALLAKARRRGADFPVGYEKWFLDYVAVATVTDVVPLLGENRALEKFGLVVLNKTNRPGLRKIIELSRTKLGEIDTQAIGFRIGPRLNAAGRISSAKIAFQTLTSTDQSEVERFANELEMLNRERQRISEIDFKEARLIAQEKKDASVQVVWSETWHPGIVGLIAGKLVTEFGVPAFALTRVGDNFVGSGRSVGGLHLVEAMRSCGDIFIKAGGHPQACGLTIASEELIYQFQTGVEKFAKEFFGSNDLKPSLNIDAELPLDHANWEVFETLQKFAPFGQSNPHPIFVAHNLQIMRADAVGKTGNHLKLVLHTGQNAWNAIGFGLGDLARQLMLGDMVDIVYELTVNEWNGEKELQASILDLKQINNG